MASWTGVRFGSNLLEKGFPNCPNPVFTSGNAPRTHLKIVLAGKDGNDMFGHRLFSIHGVGISSRSVRMSLMCSQALVVVLGA